MHSITPERRVLHAAAFALVALALGAVSASPVLARELASVRAWMPTAPEADSPSTVRPSSVQPVGPRVLSAVPTVAVRAVTPPAPLAQDTTKKPAKQVEFITRTPIPEKSKGATTLPSESQVVQAPGTMAPRYPEILKSAGVSGVTIVQFVVDTTGRPIPETMKVVRSSHQLFTNAVQSALPGLRFLPARVASRNVKQLAQMVYWFEVQGFPPRDTVVVPEGPVPTFKMFITGINQPPSQGPLQLRSQGSLNLPSDAQVVPAPGSAAPRYPEILKSAGVSGVTIVQFVVDTTGVAIPSTLKVVRSDHALFAQSVQNALPGLRFLPARVSGRNVKQLAQVVYRFEVQGFPPRDTLVVPPSQVPSFNVVVTAVAPR